MQAKDIIDEKTLETWLKTRPQVDSITIATRAYLRLGPLWFQVMQQDWPRSGDLTSFSVLRVLLTSSVACKYSTDDVKSSAASAASAPDSAPAAAAAASSSAAAAASDFAGDSVAAWALVRVDCEQLEAGQTLDGFPLWHNGESPYLAAWTETQTLWSAPNSPYAFWLRWYQAALQGNHLNLPLGHDIALIPDADWQKGPEHIAGLIAVLERKSENAKDAFPIDSELSNLPAATKDQRATFVQAVTAHQEHLPATLSALLEFCAAEISRLQGRNHPYDRQRKKPKRSGKSVF